MSNLWEGMMLRVLYFYFSHVKQIIVANLMLYIDLFLLLERGVPLKVR
jgi:hypothetical protein